ncbi:metal-dependent phosphohydrolase [Streptomyces misionensis]|uniref:Metal-dependent phosphohydrolase n=1 Tax=Streptomyces misionensis TaxID=67331 RepID=A0A5C6JV89_9ACTN|nr:metal-dependent phosphohydrolase [Streptomyces misionensis]
MRAVRAVDALMDLPAGCAGARDTPDGPGDPVDLLDHGLQAAALLAASHPDDEEARAAGLVHGLGHHLVPGGEAGHGAHAAAAVEGLLGPRVARPVALHIPAERRPAAPDPHLASFPESARTLGRQGGPMTPAEAAAFAAGPDCAAAVALGRADDAGEAAGRRVPAPETWRPVLERVAAARGRAATRPC